ncbi:pyridoxamine 5'-phosphate oxidase family protein [Amycolatopsis sp. K13G38]|uniref:Pyridoxamine 5'-phosphate oxidase family protein n=1 Tax=Amycolatopsis acididurans TaxID=2724524 RepID=A0ABX1IY15_9PSEU|nr:pyridoxamine 5'-phosphate oxidase family protein [Amycolatopsis acididurans]NKQ52046.1 pyridoxamine 5'-phosphate oxidase family protein [Amycolatopsis acididurans]
MNELRPLSSEECVTLLSSKPVGRLVFTEDAMPAIRPVNFVLDSGGDIVVRVSSQGAIAKLSSEVVAFEADEIDPVTHTGWSVVAVGKAEPIVGINELVELADPAHRPWAPGERARFLRIRVELLSGRLLTLGGALPR